MSILKEIEDYTDNEINFFKMAEEKSIESIFELFFEDLNADPDMSQKDQKELKESLLELHFEWVKNIKANLKGH